jgi:integrase
LTDFDENALPRRLRFGVCFSTAIIGACPNENFVSRDLAISDYSDRLLGEIDKRTIAQRLDEIETGSGGVTRNRVRVSLSAFFNWAGRNALVEGNPVRGTETVKERRRDRVLSDPELTAVWQALPLGDFGDIVRLLILTGQRRNEVAHLEWKEVDFAKDLIRLGPERTKNKHPHEIPLSGVARRILEIHRSGAEGFVFERFAWSTAKAGLDRRLPLAPWTIHDLRRTCATGLGNLRVPPHVIETILNHRSGHKAGVAGTYNHSAYPEEVRDALERWADHVVRSVGIDGEPKAALPTRAVRHRQ